MVLSRCVATDIDALVMLLLNFHNRYPEMWKKEMENGVNVYCDTISLMYFSACQFS